MFVAPVASCPFMYSSDIPDLEIEPPEAQERLYSVPSVMLCTKYPADKDLGVNINSKSKIELIVVNLNPADLQTMPSFLALARTGYSKLDRSISPDN